MEVLIAIYKTPRRTVSRHYHLLRKAPKLNQGFIINPLQNIRSMDPFIIAAPIPEVSSDDSVETVTVILVDNDQVGPGGPGGGCVIA